MHTPGPWTFDNEPTDDGTWYVQDSDGRDGQWVAEVANEANARLIAAAPELLEALKGLMGDHAAESRRRGFQPDDFLNYLAARAAIAKATGG
jgi:hypothetical protein